MSFPNAVRQIFGYALYQAQVGLRHRDVKPLRGLGSNVLEVITRHDGDTFRAVYTVRFRAVVYVLHAFQKKARRGIATPKPEIDLIRLRRSSPLKKSTRSASGPCGRNTALPACGRQALPPRIQGFASVARLVFGHNDSALPAERLFQRTVRAAEQHVSENFAGGYIDEDRQCEDRTQQRKRIR